MQRQDFDLIAIGGGSGGLAVAETAAARGRRVAIVAAGPLGGTCVNNGCVPKKLMWYAARLAHAVDDAPAFGIPARRGATDWARLVRERERYIDGIRDYWAGYLAERGITHLRGHGRLVDARTVAVDGRHYRAGHIVLATGSVPVVPPVPGADLGITSDGFFALPALPRRVAIVGGGYIGVELAGVLRALGAEVTLLALEARPLAAFDPMLGETLMAEMTRQGIALRTGFQVTALGEGRDGRTVHGADGQCLTGFDQVVWAVGRRPATRGLGLAAAGVPVRDDGTVVVDAEHHTPVPGIHAIGDITGAAALTPVAIAAGRRLAARLFGGPLDERLDGALVPSVVFAHPPVASVGLSEPAARARYGHVTVYETRFTPMRHALGHGGRTAMKLVCVGRDERVAGVHLIGDGADEMLQGFAVALRMGATKADFDRTLPIHPTSAEELVTLRTPRPAAGEAALATAG